VTAVIVASLGAIAAAEAAGNVEAGKAKSAVLKGRTPHEFIEAMRDYKSGKRNNAVMKTFATQLNEQDIENLAAYYASLK
jgi:cytochrome c553